MKICKTFLIILTIFAIVITVVGCEHTNSEDNNTKTAMQSSSSIINNQPAPTDLEYSLERYNVIKRSYWVNGQREKAMSLTCAIEKPLGYIVLFSDNGAIVGRFVVDGKVSSLNSYLFPAQYPSRVYFTTVDHYDGLVEIAGIDGCYGSNVSGIFFFTTDGKYIEWTGKYLYSDIPFEVDSPVLKAGGDSK